MATAVATESEKPLARELRPRAERLCQIKGWQFVCSLGAGATAAVYSIEVKGEGRALKIYSPKFAKGKRGDLVRRRLDLVLKHLTGHECSTLVQIFEGGETESILYMLMQQAAGPCLGDVLKLVPPASIREIVRQVALAARFLESKQLCHRDIKSDNIAVSSDFKHALLLDLGVVRWLDDDELVGTDHEGQLPFVATARYSSPEYMFRLVKSGPELWRGLTFYQLGGVLHDLIMKERLFEDVVRQATENRYLIAHAVATRIPHIRYDGSIPIDMVMLAQRALEKDLARRLASVDWAAFIDVDDRPRQEIILGLRADRSASQPPAMSTVPNLCRDLELSLDKLLIESGIHCRHKTEVLGSEKGTITLNWRPTTAPEGSALTVELTLFDHGGAVSLTGGATMKSASDHVTIDFIPIVSVPSESGEQLPQGLLEHAHDAFIMLSARVMEQFMTRVGTEETK